MAQRVYSTPLRHRWSEFRSKRQFDPPKEQLAAMRRFLARCSMDELHDVYTDESELGVMASEELARRKRVTIDPTVEAENA